MPEYEVCGQGTFEDGDFMMREPGVYLPCSTLSFDMSLK